MCNGCFDDCESLESVEFGAGSRPVAVGERVFRGSSLRRLSAPDGVERLGGWCSSWCKSLEAVDFGAGSQLVAIGKSAFSESSLRLSLSSSWENYMAEQESDDAPCPGKVCEDPDAL